MRGEQSVPSPAMAAASQRLSETPVQVGRGVLRRTSKSLALRPSARCCVGRGGGDAMFTHSHNHSWWRAVDGNPLHIHHGSSRRLMNPAKYVAGSSHGLAQHWSPVRPMLLIAGGYAIYCFPPLLRRVCVCFS